MVQYFVILFRFSFLYPVVFPKLFLLFDHEEVLEINFTFIIVDVCFILLCTVAPGLVYGGHLIDLETIIIAVCNKCQDCARTLVGTLLKITGRTHTINLTQLVTVHNFYFATVVVSFVHEI